MPHVFSDQEIADLVAARKVLSTGWRRRLVLRPKRGHDEAELTVAAQGFDFRVFLRRSQFNPLLFSCVLGVMPRSTYTLFRLRRYNGPHGDHTNVIERTRVSGTHIHIATERYQELGLREDGYAETTDRFTTLDQAINCMLADCGFDDPDAAQLELIS